MESGQPSKGGRRPNDIGPTGKRLAKTIRELREEAGLSWTELSQKLADLGRHLPPLSLRRIEEAGDPPGPDRRPRRVDADDLVALALALDTTPNRLLLGVEGDDYVDLTTERTETLSTAWKWAQGRVPVFDPDPDKAAKDPKRALMAFRARSLPEFLLSEPAEPTELTKAIHAELARMALGTAADPTKRTESDDGER